MESADTKGGNVDTYLTGPGYQVARQCGTCLDIGSFHMPWPQLLTLAVILNNGVSSTSPKLRAVAARFERESRPVIARETLAAKRDNGMSP